MAEAMNYSTSFSTLQSCSCNTSVNVSSTGVVGVKIGGLWKRSQGIRRFSKHNYKHRVFILTDQALSYYGGTIERVGQCKGRVQLDKIRAVEFVDLSAFNLAHVMQIVYHTKKSGFTTLYIIATTKEECSDWVSTLRQACYFNCDMLMHYHPGALIKSKWTCCLQRGQTTLGCQPTYHLLTRSSSRYAQIRRKDTLTSSQRWSRSGRTNNITGNGDGITELSDPMSSNGGVCSPRGHCLSNSCVDLCTRSPLSKEPPFTPTQRSTANTSSYRSSQNSNDHSVGMGSMFLTHVSLTTTGTEVDGEERQSRHSGILGEDASRSPMITRGKLGGRSQVAPAWTTSTSSSSSMPGGGVASTPNRHSYEYEHKTLPRSFKARASKRTEAKTHSSSSSSPGRSPRQLRRQHREELDDIGPVAPPRVRRGNGSSVSQAPPTTAVSPILEQSHPGRDPYSTKASPSTNRSPLKHSKTFTAHSSRLPAYTGAFSQSMSALARPLIEPKVSLSNPNIIHV